MPDAPKVKPAAEPEIAGHDLLIERKDLGKGCYTHIVAGDPIPAGLVGLPRRKVPTVPRVSKRLHADREVRG